MMTPNKLLQRQIRRYYSGNKIPDEMQELLKAVSLSYDHFERDRKLLERSMDISSEELKANYQKLAAQADLQRVNKELEEFVYIASHDLKEPLRSIKSFAQILSMKLEDELSQENKEFFGFITDGVKRMEILLNDLLEFARIGENKQQSEYVDLNHTLQIVLQSLQVRIEENNAQIISDTLPVVKAIPTRMQQLLQNLIGNAIKFKGAHDPIIHIKVCKEDDFYIISIQDNGIGIDDAYREKVFKVFQRLNSRNAYDGSGIGLSICKKIVNNLNGKIWLESEKGKGKTFYFTILVLVEAMVS